MPVARKELLLAFVLFLVVWVFAQSDDGYTDENRPYKFGFNIEGYQHRKEEKDEKGIIMGEFGFITADGYYRVTVYATDENGNFRILKMKNIYVGFPPDDPTTRAPLPAKSGSPIQKPNLTSPPSFSTASPKQTTKLLQSDLVDRINTPSVPPTKSTTTRSPIVGCSNCHIPTTTPKSTSINPIQTSNKNPASDFNSIQNFGETPKNPVNLNPYQPPLLDNSPPGVIGSTPNNGISFSTPSTVNFPGTIGTNSGLPGSGFGVTGTNPTGPSLGTTPSVNFGSPPFGSIQTPENIQGNRLNTNSGTSGNPPFGSIQNPGISQGNIPNSNSETSGSPPSGLNQNFGNSQGNIPNSNTETSGSPPFGLNQNSGNLQGKLPNKNTGNPPLESIQSPGSPNSNSPKIPSNINNPSHQNTFPDLNDRFGDSPESKPFRRPGDIQDGLPPGVSLSEVMGLLYKFNYTIGYHGHSEQGYLDGSKDGQYYFNSRDGRSHRVTYIANEFGYQPNITIVELGLNSPDTPKEETEKDSGLKGYEFIWYNHNNTVNTT